MLTKIYWRQLYSVHPSIHPSIRPSPTCLAWAWTPPSTSWPETVSSPIWPEMYMVLPTTTAWLGKTEHNRCMRWDRTYVVDPLWLDEISLLFIYNLFLFQDIPELRNINRFWFGSVSLEDKRNLDERASTFYTPELYYTPTGRWLVIRSTPLMYSIYEWRQIKTA